MVCPVDMRVASLNCGMFCKGQLGSWGDRVYYVNVVPDDVMSICEGIVSMGEIDYANMSAVSGVVIGVFELIKSSSCSFMILIKGVHCRFIISL